MNFDLNEHYFQSLGLHVGATTAISQDDIDLSAVLSNQIYKSRQIHEHQIAVLAQILNYKFIHIVRLKVSTDEPHTKFDNALLVI